MPTIKIHVPATLLVKFFNGCAFGLAKLSGISAWPPAGTPKFDHT